MSDKSVPDLARELWELIVAYLKQETVGTLRDLGRWIGFGVLGTLLTAMGVSMLALGGLRGLQELDTFSDRWNFAPYLIVFACLLAVAGFAGWRASRGGNVV